MILSLQKMSISNFKGIKSLELDFHGKSAAISAKNGLGKSSIVDAFTYCLFGTNANGDSPGSDKFQEKPLDEHGHIIHNLATAVELSFLLDGKVFDVKREQSENWTRRRGSAEPTFTGNTTKYFINGVELKKNEFDSRIASIAQPEIFRIIGTLGAFNALDWKKRRQHLMELAGNDVDSQLLSKPEYKSVADEMAKRNVSVDDLKKVLSDQKKTLGNELKLLPVRIEEVKKSIQTLKPHEAEDAQYMVDEAKRDIEKIERMIIDVKSQTSGGNRSQILALESELDSIRNRVKDEHEAYKRKLKFELDHAAQEVKGIEGKTSIKHDELDKLNVLLSDYVQQRDELRKEYLSIKAEKADVSDVCPTCGQTLPADKVDNAKTTWENNRKKRLSDVQTKGKSIASKIADLEQKAKAIKGELEELETALNKARGNEAIADDAIKNYPAEPDFTKEPRIAEIESQLAELKSVQDKSGADLKVKQLEESKQDKQRIIERNQAVLAKQTIAIENEGRVKEYEAQLKELGTKLSETELILDNLERFTTDRCSALEDNINGHFKTVKWKLFDTLINGSINDCCVAMILCNGVFVPYQSANTASQIAADIEIADVLMKQHDVRVPLFIDNKERTNALPVIDTQVITLAVSMDDRLKVELID